MKNPRRLKRFTRAAQVVQVAARVPAKPALREAQVRPAVLALPGAVIVAAEEEQR